MLKITGYGNVRTLYEKTSDVSDVFQNENDYDQLLCTYNVEYDEDYVEGVKDTISLHRKKQTNS